MKLPTSVTFHTNGQICLEWENGVKVFTVWLSIDEAYTEFIDEYPRAMDFQDTQLNEFEFNKAIAWVEDNTPHKPKLPA